MITRPGMNSNALQASIDIECEVDQSDDIGFTTGLSMDQYDDLHSNQPPMWSTPRRTCQLIIRFMVGTLG